MPSSVLTTTAPVGAPAQALLTLYPAGLANLNGEAVRQLPRRTESLLLLPPGEGRPYWLALALENGIVGDAPLAGRCDRPGTLRFRSVQLATALFAALPAGQPHLRLELVPAGSCGRLFWLRPLSHLFTA